MAGFTSLNVGVLGLKAAQAALNTTSHNLVNVYTEGYVRQTAVFNDYSYKNVSSGVNGKMQVGLGVYVAKTSRVRDILLDASYRQEVGKKGFYTAQYETVLEVETYLGETEGTRFQDELTALYNAISEVAKDPGNDVARSGLVMSAQTFLDRATSVYNNLTAYQETLNTKIKDTVDRINELGDTINELNKKISTIEGPGIESANDLRDLRDNALDELASLVQISYQENENHVVEVKIEGVPFLTQANVYHMGTAQLNAAEGSTYLTPVWPFLENEEVFNLNVEISGNKDNDNGTLKGLLLARGDFVADYTDIPKPEDYASDAEYYDAVKEYNLTIDSSVIMKTQALFDQLINGIVTRINDILSPTTTATFTDTSGNVYSDVLVLDTANCATGTDGELPPQELFSRKNTERYTEVTADDGTVYYVYNTTNTFGNESLYTCSNLEMNQVVVGDYTKLPYKNNDGVDMELGEALKNAWDESFSNLDPNSLTEKTFTAYYEEFVYEIGNMGDLYESISLSYGVSAETVNSSRQQITGVSSEEELSNMIRFQSAYNASSRYITVIDEMLEHIIERLS